VSVPLASQVNIMPARFSSNPDEVVRLLLPRTLSPQLSFELFIHIEDNGADVTIRESLIHPEDKIPFVQMWIRATVARPMVVNRTEIVLQKGTWLAPENRTFSFRIVCEKPGIKLLNTQPKMLGKASDIRRFQGRMDGLAAVGALGALDFLGYFPIEIMDLKINPTGRESRSLEKATECPVGLFALLHQLLNSLDVGFKFHISANRATEISGGCKQEWLGKLQLTLCISINKSFCNS
jgi:hypothetical protein